MNKNNSKRGSHVGAVLSFVVFIVFLVFTLSILEPAARVGDEEKESLIGYLDREITENSTYEMTRSIVEVEATSQGGNGNANYCIELIGIGDEDGLDLEKLVVKNDDSQVDWEKEGSDLKLGVSSNDISGTGFFEISSSEILGEEEDIEDNCLTITERNGEQGNNEQGNNKYEISSSRTYSYPFESKIKGFLDSYDEDYEGLKDRINFPGGAEFNISFRGSDSEEGVYHEFNAGGSRNVYVEEKSIRYIDDEANINSGFIIFGVW